LVLHLRHPLIIGRINCQLKMKGPAIGSLGVTCPCGAMMSLPGSAWHVTCHEHQLKPLTGPPDLRSRFWLCSACWAWMQPQIESFPVVPWVVGDTSPDRLVGASDQNKTSCAAVWAPTLRRIISTCFTIAASVWCSCLPNSLVISN
jgi:hypothetical protein